MNPPPTVVHASPRYRIYRCGVFGYAYNPNTKLWEVYEFDRDCGNEIVDLCGNENSRRQAHGDALRRNDARRRKAYEDNAQIEIGRVWDNPAGYWRAEVHKGSLVICTCNSTVCEKEVREKAALVVDAFKAQAHSAALPQVVASLRELRAAAMNTPALDSSPEWTALISKADAALEALK